MIELPEANASFDLPLLVVLPPLRLIPESGRGNRYSGGEVWDS